MATDDRAALAETVSTHARLVSAMLRGRKRPMPLLTAVAVAQVFVRVAEDVLRALVSDARAAGHTWQEIGDALGTSRQAAFQRFTGPQS